MVHLAMSCTIAGTRYRANPSSSHVLDSSKRRREYGEIAHAAPQRIQTTIDWHGSGIGLRLKLVDMSGAVGVWVGVLGVGRGVRHVDLYSSCYPNQRATRRLRAGIPSGARHS